MLKPTPGKLIVVGLVGSLLFGFYTVKLHTATFSPLSQGSIILIEGVVDRAEEINPNKGSATLQVWLQGQRLPFRSSWLYPDYYDREALSRLRPGVPVKIGVTQEEVVSPRKDRLHGQEFLQICSLEVRNRVALPLETFNAWSAKNEKVGKVTAPALLACALGALALGWCQKRKEAAQR